MSKVPDQMLTLVEVLAKAQECQEKGDMFSADQLYWRILGVEPRVPDAWNALAIMAHVGGRNDVALVFVKRAIELAHTFAHYHNVYGKILLALHRTEEAKKTLEWASQLDAECPHTWNNLGTAYKTLDDPKKAAECYRKAISLAPDLAAAHSNLSSAYHTLQMKDEAVAAGYEAVRCRPEWPEAHWNLALSLLLAERWEEGWKEFEHRWGSESLNSPVPPLAVPEKRWHGEDLQGKTLLIWSEQGSGDMIQFARYLPLLARLGAKIKVFCIPVLMRLFENVEGVAQVSNDSNQLGEFDYHVPIMSIPLEAELYQPGWEGAYVKPPIGHFANHADFDTERALTEPAGDALKVGICWAGNPSHNNDRNRSLALSALPLDTPGVVWYNLQKGEASEQLLACDKDVVDVMPACKDFWDTAAVIAHLDLVITVDTAVAHLAGAMGKTTWLILPEGCDWRWGVRQNDSVDRTVWYPNTVLFRGGKAALPLLARLLAERATSPRQTANSAS